jgi:hypothetical protein
MFNLFNPLRDYLAWRRNDRDERVVATAEYVTNILRRDGTKTGQSHAHIVSYWEDGNGCRWTPLDSTSRDYAAEHEGVVASRVSWRVHGKIPAHARRVDDLPCGEMVSSPGGKPAA